MEIECAPATLTFNYQALVDRFRAMSRDERRLCLNRLLDILRPPERTVQAEYLARGIVELAREGLVEDGAVLRPLIECQSRHLNSLGTSCNQATVALTRHPYGQTFFAQQRGAPAFTVDNRDRIVADWRELDRLLEDGHPVFDSLLADECASAIRAIGARLVETLTAVIPHHAVLGYLGNIPNEASTILKTQGQAERIFSFAIGGPSAGPGFDVPGNWIGRGPLQGLRILMFRPGIPHPVSGRPSPEIQGFPVSDADYHEVFKALDLEVRFQIVTSSDDLRRTTIDAVKQALNGLRRVNARGSAALGTVR